MSQPRTQMIRFGDAQIMFRPPRWWLALRAVQRKLLGRPGQAPSPTAPTFIWPAISAIRWAAAWAVAMVHDSASWKWVFLLGFCVHFWRTLRRLERFLWARAADNL
jgi:hypothetical protein